MDPQRSPIVPISTSSAPTPTCATTTSIAIKQTLVETKAPSFQFSNRVNCPRNAIFCYSILYSIASFVVFIGFLELVADCIVLIVMQDRVMAMFEDEPGAPDIRYLWYYLGPCVGISGLMFVLLTVGEVAGYRTYYELKTSKNGMCCSITFAVVVSLLSLLRLAWIAAEVILWYTLIVPQLNLLSESSAIGGEVAMVLSYTTYFAIGLFSVEGLLFLLACCPCFIAGWHNVIATKIDLKDGMGRVSAAPVEN